MINFNQTIRLTGATALAIESSNEFDLDLETKEDQGIFLGNLMTSYIYYDFNDEAIFSLVDIIDKFAYKMVPICKMLTSTIQLTMPLFDDLEKSLNTIQLDQDTKKKELKE